MNEKKMAAKNRKLTNKKNMLEKKIRIFFSIAMALGIISIAVYEKDRLIAVCQDLKSTWIQAGLFFYLLAYYFRSQRLRAISKNRIPLWPTSIYCSTLHGFATYMLPFRSGDFTLPFILKSTGGFNLTEGLKILYKARLLDIFTLGIWTLLAVMYPYWRISAYIRSGLCIVGGLMISMPYLLRFFLVRFSSLKGKIGSMIKGLSRVEKFRLPEVIQSACIWAALAACFYCIAKAVGLSLPFGGVWLLIVIQLPLQLIPIQGLANSGNHEGGWVAGLTLIGMSPESALGYAVISHVVLLLYVLFAGLVAFIFGIFQRYR